jgi:hypothetical protein
MTPERMHARGARRRIHDHPRTDDGGQTREHDSGDRSPHPAPVATTPGSGSIVAWIPNVLQAPGEPAESGGGSAPAVDPAGTSVRIEEFGAITLRLSTNFDSAAGSSVIPPTYSERPPSLAPLEGPDGPVDTAIRVTRTDEGARMLP